MRGCFVTGTDTGAGKTIVAAAIAARLAARGARVRAFKPVVTGTAEQPAPGFPPDHELLAAVTGQRPAEVTPVTFGPPASPHLAARLAGEELRSGPLLAAARAAGERAEALVVEGVGGLLVPLTEDSSVRDFASALGLPLVIAARPGLGTISHTLLTIESARAAGLRVAAVVLTPWPREPTVIERDNRLTVERLGAVAVHGLPPVEAATPARLAAAAGSLPAEDWIGAQTVRSASVGLRRAARAAG